MDEWTVLVEMTKATAWPAVIAGIAFGFRKEISQSFGAAVSAFERLKKISYAGVTGEMVDAFSAAAIASEEKVDITTKKLVNEELTAEERERLVNELKAATTEADQLRKAVDNLTTAQSLNSENPSDVVMLNVAIRGLREIVDGITTVRVVELDKSKRHDELFMVINRFIKESIQKDRPFSNIFPITIHSLRNFGILTNDNSITPYGVSLIVDMASGRGLNTFKRLKNSYLSA
ncbi:hypothetical protein N0K08_17430 [Acidovorax sp. Be4]|uniref:Uncharacterized protein n=1 Tax=Acidovorax bellezanensis TaxID=2976702 RepID=A0ABT2PPQ5_9BURK|nr:hypothetical protein [Acidovorax sp. Be4]MCT9812428.1 hypothetical protein [Acidovorax sp. Be4]